MLRSRRQGEDERGGEGGPEISKSEFGFDLQRRLRELHPSSLLSFGSFQDHSLLSSSSPSSPRWPHLTWVAPPPPTNSGLADTSGSSSSSSSFSPSSTTTSSTRVHTTTPTRSKDPLNCPVERIMARYQRQGATKTTRQVSLIGKRELSKGGS